MPTQPVASSLVLLMLSLNYIYVLCRWEVSGFLLRTLFQWALHSLQKPLELIGEFDKDRILHNK